MANSRFHGLENSEAYRQISEKYQALSLKPQPHRGEKRAIVLAANYPYLDQVLATMKSVLYHHRNIRFTSSMVISTGWFTGMNRHLVRLIVTL